jgi:preprotein translocase subunit SecD
MNFSLRRVFSTEVIFWIALAGFGLWYILPLNQKIRYGIDLVGGTYLTLEVQTDKAVETELVERLEGIEEKIKAGNAPKPNCKSVRTNEILLTFNSAADAQAAAAVLKDTLKDLSINSDANTLSFKFSDREVKRIKDNAVTRNIEVLRTRLRSDITEIPVTAQGEKNIVVELPNVANIQEEKAKIVQTAKLDFRLIEKHASTEDELLAEYGDDLPADKEILTFKDKNRGYFLVSKYSDITGKLLKEARATYGGQTGAEAVVAFKFNDVGGDRFYNLTSKNYGRSLAIVLDNTLVSVATIQAAIRDEGVISGNFTIQSAKELALLLQSGSFVAPITFEEERQVGPTLGAESIRQGLMSCAVAFGLIFLFCIFFYKGSGLLAFVSLLFNLLLVLMGVAWLKASLTLPGIAGIVLTIGMAVDASILIYERIKEELASGASVRKAVDAGFGGARAVILDANITTFLAGIVLYYFGTGPVKGFAVTMMLGIIATLIAGILFLRSLFKFILSNFNIQKLSI